MSKEFIKFLTKMEKSVTYLVDIHSVNSLTEALRLMKRQALMTGATEDEWKEGRINFENDSFTKKTKITVTYMVGDPQGL